MNISDPIADMLTRVRNASRARHTDVVVPASRTKREIARILKDEGFVADVSEEQEGPTAEIPRVLGGLGIVIVSTSQGIMTGQQARQAQLGGEVLAYVW